jgi:hypothetical protein
MASDSGVGANASYKKSTNQFIRQGHTEDGTYGSSIQPKSLDGTDKPVKDLKP